jgi:hypothetical protein
MPAPKIQVTYSQLGALRELQDGMALSEADANAWVQQVRDAPRYSILSVRAGSTRAGRRAGR